MGKDTIEKLKKYIKDDRPHRLKSFIRKHKIDVLHIELTKGQTLLHYSCKYGREEICRFLMKCPFDLCEQDHHGNTALHLAIKYALKSDSNSVYSSIILPLIERSPELLEVYNHDNVSCRSLLDKLVQKRQRDSQNKEQDYKSEENKPRSWEEKLAEEFQNEYDDFSGRYNNDENNYSDAETYDEWADRLRREYHHKHRYGSHKQRESTKDKQSQEDSKKSENLEDIRAKLRKKYEENMKRDEANRAVMKSRNYHKNMKSLLSFDGTIKLTDIPWPYKTNVVEIRNIMFYDVLSDNDGYKKRLREEQIRWHPDKFLQKHGKNLCENDRNQIMDRVKEISQELNRLSNLL